MLSFGMEYDFAFSIAFCSARLPDGSPPPSFAATMIARESFEKSLPRFASAAPFLCLIDDHLLCPDTVCLPYEVQEELVDARVVGQLRVERGDEDPPVAREHRMAVDLGENLDVGPRVFDPRRADEDGAHRLVAVAEVEIGFERVHLAAEGVPRGTECRRARDARGRARSCRRRCRRSAPRRQAGLVEAVEAHEPRDRGRLAPGQDQAVEARELPGQAHLDRLRAEASQDGRVLAEIALNGENPDPKRLAHGADCNDG